MLLACAGVLQPEGPQRQPAQPGRHRPGLLQRPVPGCPGGGVSLWPPTLPGLQHGPGHAAQQLHGGAAFAGGFDGVMDSRRENGPDFFISYSFCTLPSLVGSHSVFWWFCDRCAGGSRIFPQRWSCQRLSLGLLPTLWLICPYHSLPIRASAWALTRSTAATQRYSFCTIPMTGWWLVLK